MAANDFQRDLLLPALFARSRRRSAGDAAGDPLASPSAAMLRENRCDLLISPLPPTGAASCRNGCCAILCLLL